MKYKVLKIAKAFDNYFDIDYREVRLFSEPKTFFKVRTKCDFILATIVSNGEYIHNMMQILEAYGFSDVDFTQRDEPLPIVYSILGKAIY